MSFYCTKCKVFISAPSMYDTVCDTCKRSAYWRSPEPYILIALIVGLLLGIVRLGR